MSEEHVETQKFVYVVQSIDDPWEPYVFTDEEAAQALADKQFGGTDPMTGGAVLTEQPVLDREFVEAQT